MVGDLLDSLYEYKTQMDYQNADFNADKAKQYKAIRKMLAAKYVEQNCIFGPVEIGSICEGEEEKAYKKRCEDENAQIRKGYSRIQEKVKSLRQKFSNAVTDGNRSGSGKMVMEFYDIMVQIWGGAPATEPLSFGVQSFGVQDSGLGNELDSLAEFEQSLLEDEVTTGNSEEVDLDDDQNPPATGNNNRKRASNMVPALIDNKRKHMERQLSAAQRDKILLQESKDEREFRKELTKSLKESSAMFAESMKAMSSSMAALASSIQKSFDPATRFPYTQPSVPQVHHMGSNYIYQNSVGSASQPMYIHQGQNFNEECNGHNEQPTVGTRELVVN